MNKIGFQNFRKFKHFPIIEYSGITFLVGPNNSGKSTLVKALLLFNNYIKETNFKKFPFGNLALEDVNLITYGRAKFNKAENNQISFQFQFGDYLVLLTISGEDDKSFANVVLLEIHDYSNGFTFTFNVLSETIKIVMEEVTKENLINESLIKNLEMELKYVNEQLTNINLKKTSKEYIELNTLKVKFESNLNNLLKKEILNFPKISILEGNFENFESVEEIVENLLQNSQEKYNNEYIKIQQGHETPIGFEDLKSFNEFGLISIYEGIFNEIINVLQTTTFTYVRSTTNKQSALFFIRDKNNSLSQAIHEFKQLNITEGEVEHLFVLKWMREFGIGENFNIQMYACEAYEMTIKTNSGSMHLADYGMGSLQIMSILMKLACEIKEANLEKNEMDTFMSNLLNKTIIFEEPELNLHPAFQSKLTDVFLDVHQRFGIDFIIETHSEYILRRSQVIVAENDFEVAPNENPFCVHYFPKEYDQMPYQLKYQPDGTFDKNFGTGFFDTASLDTLKLLRIKREKKA